MTMAMIKTMTNTMTMTMTMTATATATATATMAMTMTNTLQSHFKAISAQISFGNMGCQPDLSPRGMPSPWSQWKDELFEQGQSLLGQDIANWNAVVHKDATFRTAQGANYESPKEEEVLKDILSKRDRRIGEWLQKLLPNSALSAPDGVARPVEGLVQATG